VSDNLLAGIDCGATKVLIQSAIIEPGTKNVYPGKISKEFVYSDHAKWNKKFLPVPLNIQKCEFDEKRVSLKDHERTQGRIIIDTIRKAMDHIKYHKKALCYPGIKYNNDIVIMANGPRIINMKKKIGYINTIYNDSECCVIGEWKSSIGKMKNIKNGIYVGGGTGIADGLIIDGQLIDFSCEKSPKRSWELLLPSGASVESLLSPSGIIKQYNKLNNSKIKKMNEILKSKNYQKIFSNAAKAFAFLVKNRTDFFQKRNKKIEKIIIGQRLGEFLSNENILSNLIRETTDIEVKFSSDRRTAALGAVWKLICS
tara:strand:+ start:651 stop:1589 length:939 start_codon:yes stop_codon:yes gene_type:complete